MIDASCQKAKEERPTIRIAGSLIQKGVALATAIELDGWQKVFVPAGFFQALTTAVRPFVPGAIEPPLIAP